MPARQQEQDQQTFEDHGIEEKLRMPDKHEQQAHPDQACQRSARPRLLVQPDGEKDHPGHGSDRPCYNVP